MILCPSNSCQFITSLYASTSLVHLLLDLYVHTSLVSVLLDPFVQVSLDLYVHSVLLDPFVQVSLDLYVHASIVHLILAFISLCQQAHVVCKKLCLSVPPDETIVLCFSM